MAGPPDEQITAGVAPPEAAAEPHSAPGPPSAAEPLSDDDRLAAYAVALADGVEAALPAWVARAVATRLPPDEVARRSGAIERAGSEAGAEVGARVRDLLALDVDDQWTNPLTLIRGAIRYPNAILREAGAPEVARDAQAVRFLPDDVYDLAPASFADLGPELHDLGISWGAAKAHVHLRRRREEETP